MSYNIICNKQIHIFMHVYDIPIDAIQTPRAKVKYEH